MGGDAKLSASARSRELVVSIRKASTRPDKKQVSICISDIFSILFIIEKNVQEKLVFLFIFLITIFLILCHLFLSTIFLIFVIILLVRGKLQIFKLYAWHLGN